jgi:hypothetical protein
MSVKLPVYHILPHNDGSYYIALVDGDHDVCRDHRHPSYEDAEREMREWEEADREAKEVLEDDAMMQTYDDYLNIVKGRA